MVQNSLKRHEMLKPYHETQSTDFQREQSPSIRNLKEKGQSMEQMIHGISYKRFSVTSASEKQKPRVETKPWVEIV